MLLGNHTPSRASRHILSADDYKQMIGGYTMNDQDRALVIDPTAMCVCPAAGLSHSHPVSSHDALLLSDRIMTVANMRV
jgi:hypothetical protein